MKNEAPILSIIVPSYNTSRFFPRYFEMYGLPERKEEFEVIFVNDGSTDNTEQLAQELCAKAPNRFRLISKENGGHGSAINVGVQEAKGKYFRVIDGDDSIDKASLLLLIDALRDASVDAVVTDFRLCYSDESKNEDVKCGGSGKGGLLAECFLKFHSIFYRTDFWKSHQIKLTEKVFYEDQEYVLFPIPFIDSWEYFPIVAYNYSLDVPGQSISPASMKKHFGDHCIVANSVLEYTRQALNDPNSKNKETVVQYAASCLGLHLEMVALVSDAKAVRSELRSFYRSLGDLPEIQKKALGASKGIRLISICHFAFARLLQPWLKAKKGFKEN